MTTLRGFLILRGDRCRCTACGEYFTTTSNFDRHRIGKGEDRGCAIPSDVGLVRNQRGFWSRPGKPGIYQRNNSVSGDLDEAAMVVAP